MSNDIYQLPQCTCSALFLTSDALNAHLYEYRSRESYLSAQQDICRSHSKVNDDDDQDSDDGNDSGVNEDSDSLAIRHVSSDKRRNCPLKNCDRTIPFTTRQKLRRHFEQHVKCEEVCVCCHQVSRRVSDYIRHTKGHRDVDKTKATYINQMCDELRHRATNELRLAERRRVSRGNKMVRERGYIGTRTSRVQNAKFHTLDMTIMNELNFQPANDTQAVLPSMQSAAVLMPLSNVAKPAAIGDFPNMSSETFYPESIRGPTAALDDINFDAPINSIMNFPEWDGWMQVENRTEN